MVPWWGILLLLLLAPSACMICYLFGSYLYLLWWNGRSSRHPAPTAERVREDEATEREILLSSASQLARGLREGRYTSRQLVETFRRQITAVDRLVHAVCHMRPEAIQDAIKADEALNTARKAGPDAVAALPPFHGVPTSIKECLGVEGMEQTGGLVARSGFIASESATAVARMQAAGFIPVATTNVSELCMWYESYNKVYGRTNNPYNLHRLVGGSSGGEACLVSAAGAPVGLGSDIGGSIRMPSFFNMLFGHKATGGLVPGTGQFPFSTTRLLTTGPMCRYAEDLWPMLCVVAGSDGRDAASDALPLLEHIPWRPTDRSLWEGDTPEDGEEWGAQSPLPDHLAPFASTETVGKYHKDAVARYARMRRVRPPRPPQAFAMDRVKVFVMADMDSVRTIGGSPCDPELIAATHRAARALCGTLGCEGPFDFPLSEMKHAFTIWSATLNADCPPAFCEMLGYGEKLNVGRLLLQWLLCDHPAFTGPSLLLALIEDLPKWLPGHHADMYAVGQRLKERINETLGENGVLLLPTHPTTASVHNLAMFRSMNAGWTALFNAMKTPVTSCPAGLSSEQVPLGLQIVGAQSNDGLTIRVAQELEKLGLRWIPPPVANLS